MRKPTLVAEAGAKRTGAGDAGVTLIELLITMAVFSLVIGLIFQGVITVQRMAEESRRDAESVSQLRQGLAIIDRQVRSGNVLYSPGDEDQVLSTCEGTGTSGSCMRVYTQANGDERCVQWQVIADADAPGTSALRMRSWSPTWQTDGLTTGWSTVSRGLVNPGEGNWPFTLQGGTSAFASRLLDVNLGAVDLNDPSESDELSASISGRNTNYGYDAGRCSPAPTA
ncbi:MAG: prepilin-type N-terminal cleavage/methylation domain-containing protein [Candidatus Nanopelagicales bacterium]